MSSDVPKARRNIRFIMENFDISEEVRQLLAQTERLMYRERHKPVIAEPTSDKMTPEIASKIMHDLAQDPSLSTKELAERYNVNQGRVSTAIQRYGR